MSYKHQTKSYRIKKDEKYIAFQDVVRGFSYEYIKEFKAKGIRCFLYHMDFGMTRIFVHEIDLKNARKPG